MKFKNVVLESFAYALPNNDVTTESIESELEPLYQKLNLSKGRIELMTGIKSRKLWPNGTFSSELSTEVGEKIFLKSKIKKEEVDLLIHASVCRDFLEPATASVVHNKLKLPNKTMIFDLSNACLGVMNSILMAASMIECGQIKTALIVSGENGGPLLSATLKELLTNPEINRKNIKKFIANLTIGSAATAIMLSHIDLSPDSSKILGGVVETDSSANHLCRGDGNAHSLVMETHSEELLKYGIELGQSLWPKFLNELKWNQLTPKLVLTHQVGIAHEKLSLQSLELNNHKTFKTYPFLGNTGSSALPITLMMAFENNQMQKGDEIALLGIGSGLSSIMLGIKW